MAVRRCLREALVLGLLLAGRPAAATTYTITELGTLGGTTSAATAINASGQIVGFATTEKDAAQHAFLYSGGSMVDLGTLGGPDSSAQGINDTGAVVGYQAASPGAALHAILHAAGTLTDLQTAPGFTQSLALGINAHGRIVGLQAATTTLEDARAFLREGGVWKALNTLIPADSGWVLRIATAINDAGEIVGRGDFGGHTRAFLLKPVPGCG